MVGFERPVDMYAIDGTRYALCPMPWTLHSDLNVGITPCVAQQAWALGFRGLQ